MSARPDLVTIPRSVDHVAPLIRAAVERGIPVVARGAGTGYSGGAIPVRGGLVLCLSALTRLEIDPVEGSAWVEPGVVTHHLAQAALAAGWRYAPDPSSYRVCTMGGNLATNAGGPHSLASGVTTNYVDLVRVVTTAGDVVDVGPATDERLDLRGLLVGSEGTLGVIVGARVRLRRPPERTRTVLATFERTESAIHAVELLFEKACVPAALDMSTGALLPVQGEMKSVDSTVLFIDVEGFEEEVVEQLATLARVLTACGGTAEVLEVPELMIRRAAMVQERVRKLTTHTGASRYFLFDAVVPRSRLAQAMAAIQGAAQKHQMPLLNTFHAGDGNLHPTPFYHPGKPAVASEMMSLWREILLACRDLDGALSGEHGIGLEKAPFMADFTSETTLELLRRIKSASDPAGLCNPGKLLPEPGKGASTRIARPRPRLDFSLLDGHVSAGGEVTLAEIREALSATPYELAWEPMGAADDVTLGEAIAQGWPGARDLRQGPSRDVLLGGVIEVRSGVEIEFGSRMAKDASGYQLRKLIFGSHNRLGRVRFAHLRIVPRSRGRHARAATLTSLCDAVHLAEQLHRTSLPWSLLGLRGSGGSSTVEVLALLETTCEATVLRGSSTRL
ncbi:MAG: FAD-linked oxidase C-terminal domain-containing protein [Polyangiaceae bacterium]